MRRATPLFLTSGLLLFMGGPAGGRGIPRAPLGAGRGGDLGRVRATRYVASRLSGKRAWSRWVMQAESIDLAVEAVYGRGGAVAASFLLSLLGWLGGQGRSSCSSVFWDIP